MNLQTLKSPNLSNLQTSQVRNYTDCVHFLVSGRRQRGWHLQANFEALDSRYGRKMHLLRLIFNKFLYFRVITDIILQCFLFFAPIDQIFLLLLCSSWAKWFENFISYMTRESVPSCQSDLLEGGFFLLHLIFATHWNSKNESFEQLWIEASKTKR